MFVQRHEVQLNTGTGVSAAAATRVVNGRVLSVHYERPAAGALATGAGIRIVTEVTGQEIWAESPGASAIRVPRQVVHDAAGAATATDTIRAPFYVGGERLVVTATGAGAGQSGIVRILAG